MIQNITRGTTYTIIFCLIGQMWTIPGLSGGLGAELSVRTIGEAGDRMTGGGDAILD